MYLSIPTQVMISKGQFLVHRSLLVAALLLLIAPCQSRAQTEQPTAVCNREKREIVVPYEGPLEGCESAVIRVWTCYGRCGSTELVKTNAPYREAACNCCSNTHHQIKPRTLAFKCQGIEEPQLQKVYLPVVKSCGCRECGVSFGL